VTARRLSWTVLAANVIVIVGGGLVRATGSGAGCGRSWPTCQGEVLPALQGATAIEFSHRILTVIAGLLGLALLRAVFVEFRKGHPARKAVVVAATLFAVEGLIGRALVEGGWVADDASLARAIIVPLHLMNTFLLLAALTLTVFFVSGGTSFRLGRKAIPHLVVAVVAVVVAATGSITALADTLFPKDFSLGSPFATDEHFLTELRVVHPFVSVALVLAVFWLGRRMPGRAARWAVAVAAVQLAVGPLNVVLGTPVWLSLVHLALADAFWVAWIWALADMNRPSVDRLPSYAE
jgi:cytochrome c oxidase assembly protein subunit 15